MQAPVFWITLEPDGCGRPAPSRVAIDTSRGCGFSMELVGAWQSLVYCTGLSIRWTVLVHRLAGPNPVAPATTIVYPGIRCQSSNCRFRFADT